MMNAEFLHVGIPVKKKKEDMMYDDNLKLWYTEPENSAFSIEYLLFGKETPMPELIRSTTHIAYLVEDMKPYIKMASQVLFGPVTLDADMQFAFVEIDNVLIELISPK